MSWDQGNSWGPPAIEPAAQSDMSWNQGNSWSPPAGNAWSPPAIEPAAQSDMWDQGNAWGPPAIEPAAKRQKTWEEDYNATGGFESALGVSAGGCEPMTGFDGGPPVSHHGGGFLVAAAPGSGAVVAPPSSLREKTKICSVFTKQGFCLKDMACMYAHGEHEIGMPQPSLEVQRQWEKDNAGLRIKNRICSNWAAGFCQRGSEACFFAHGDDELGTFCAVPEAPQKGSWDSGKGFGKVVTPPGMGVGAGGGQGKVVEPPAWQWSSPVPQQQSKRFIKTKICMDWERSGGTTCPRGISCTFAHGQDDVGKAIPQELHNRVQNQAGVRSKIKLCTNWVNGNCPRGNVCSFAHGEHELGTPQPAGDGQSAFNPMDNAESSFSPMPPGGGKGAMSPGCGPFQQQVKPFSPAGMSPSGPSFTERPQYFEQSLHRRTGVRKKTKICREWERSGKCPRQDRCTFAHGEGELGTPIPSELISEMEIRSKTKSKVCGAFTKGMCNRGDQCTFAHGEHEVGLPQPGQPGGVPIDPNFNPPPNRQEYPRMQSQMMPQNVPHGEVLLKSEICSEFFDVGACPRGGMCCFIHGEEEIGTPQPMQSNHQQSVHRGPFPQQGVGGGPFPQQGGGGPFPQQGGGGPFPQQGGGGPFPQQMQASRPSRFSSAPPQPVQNMKTEVCANWLEGRCSYGDMCLFAHGENEVGTPLPGMANQIMQQSMPQQQPSQQVASPFPQMTSSVAGPGGCGGGVADGTGKQETTPERQMFNFKTMICNDFTQQGSCRRGDNCSFAHGEVEMLKPGEALQLMHQMEAQNAPGGAAPGVADGASGVAAPAVA